METYLTEEEQKGFSLAVGIFTNLLVNQKDLITEIIETAYTQGVQAGMVYAKQNTPEIEVGENMENEILGDNNESDANTEL